VGENQPRQDRHPATDWCNRLPDRPIGLWIVWIDE